MNTLDMKTIVLNALYAQYKFTSFNENMSAEYREVYELLLDGKVKISFPDAEAPRAEAILEELDKTINVNWNMKESYIKAITKGLRRSL